MSAKAMFLGAARGVTGSRYLFESDGIRVLIDCGLYQERDLLDRNWDPFPVPPSSLDAVLLTHAHLDHSGLLPKLVREGFSGPIYCTPATAELTSIVLIDSAGIQEEDAAFKKKRHAKEGRRVARPEVPLYTADEARVATGRFQTVPYEKPVRLSANVQATFRDAGHILGSAMICIEFRNGGSPRSIVFSGDIGRPNKPILRDPTVFTDADYVVMESTYGNRVHEDKVDMCTALAEVINSTRREGGNVLIPSFAIERAQEVLYQINCLRIEDRIPPLLVFLDSPMAVNATRVMMKHEELFDADMRDLVRNHRSPFAFQGLTMTETAEASKSINAIRGTSVIIAGSGMCTGGRIKHHLVQNISRPESAVLFVGYQAAGTLGRLIVEGIKEVRILGKTYPVRSRIAQLHGFSAHADRNELLTWISGLRRPPKRVFVTHGEPEAAQSFAALVSQRLSFPTSVPGYRDEAPLD